jgi:nitroimidazol reductase NimA-like FMN-containing flavoprotein (pyridoxamine 5'-phosphate oxidase superfamily)
MMVQVDERQPVAERPYMPGYGIQPLANGDSLISWARVSEQMAKAHNYWVSTTRPDGRPHAMPIWGIWLDETFYFGTARGSVKGRNLAHNPAISVHLESGDDVVILEGVAEEVHEAAQLAHIYHVYGQKYGLDMSQNAKEGADPTYALRPTTGFAWLEHDFPNTATRFRF